MAQGSVEKQYELLLIGGSAGSLEALLELLPVLPLISSLSIVVVVHRRNGESHLSELLSEKTVWRVKEAEEKEKIIGGTIYIAPADYHLLIEKNKTFSLDDSEKINYSRPSIDVTFETGAEAYGDLTMALLLSGANQDGTEGLRRIKEAGGYTMVQDPAEAVVNYMPQHAIERAAIDKVIKIEEVPSAIHHLLLL